MICWFCLYGWVRCNFGCGSSGQRHCRHCGNTGWRPCPDCYGSGFAGGGRYELRAGEGYDPRADSRGSYEAACAALHADLVKARLTRPDLSAEAFLAERRTQ